MTIEAKNGLGVDSIYGSRELGGGEGYKKTSGITYEVAVNFDGTQKSSGAIIPAGAIITQIEDDLATGTVSAGTVGSVNIIGALAGTKVPVPAGGELTLAGATAGTVIVQYIFTV